MLDRLNLSLLASFAWNRRVLFFLVPLVGCASPKRGLLIMAHGGDPQWNRDVEAVVEPLRGKYPTEIAFGMAQPSSIRAAVGRLEEKGVREIAVVRMFISGDSFVPATEYILGLRSTPPADPLASRGTESVGFPHVQPVAFGHPGFAGTNHSAKPEPDGNQPHPDSDHGGHCMETLESIQSSSRFVLSYDGVGESPLIDGILHDRVKALSSDPLRESVLILAHGPADDAENNRWLANMSNRLQKLKGIGSFRELRCETLREDWPQRRLEAEQRIRAFVEDANRNGGRCLIVPFRVAGFGPYKEVLAGMNYVADERGFCPHPNMTRWIEESARKCWR